MKTILNTTILESRETPALVNLSGGVLSIVAGDFATTVNVINDSDDIVLLVADEEGANEYRFNGVDISTISFSGGAGADGFYNFTNVSEILSMGAGNDAVLTGFGEFSVVNLGAGRDNARIRTESAIVNAVDGEIDRIRILNSDQTIVLVDTNDTVI